MSDLTFIGPQYDGVLVETCFRTTSPNSDPNTGRLKMLTNMWKDVIVSALSNGLGAM